MNVSARVTVVAALVAVTAGCEGRDLASPEGPFPELGLTVPITVEGETGPGSLYKLYLPPNWNGDLVVYAHGYVAPGEPIALPDVDPLPDLLTGYGYGVAYSSYSENGYAIKDAVVRTRQLRGIFASNFGMPEKTYLAGHSEGAIIVLMLAEQNPGLFDGALPMCGLVGGGPMQVQYLLDTRVVFDFFFPGLIPGTALGVPPGVTFEDVAPAVTGAMLANPAATFQLAAVDQLGIASTDLFEIVDWVLSALYYNIVGTEDLLGRTNGRAMVSNVDVVYTGTLNDALLNDPVYGVERVASTPDAANYLRRWYQPTGRLSVPTLTLHTTRDGAVPFFHEAAYASLVDGEGAGDYLVQRDVDRYGHCNFTLQEQQVAFLDLVTWVELGLEPMP